MHSDTNHALAVVLAVALVATAIAPAGTAAAQSAESDATDGLLSTAGDYLDALYGAAQGYVARLTDDPADRDALDAAMAVKSDLNTHQATYRAYLNNHTTPSAAFDVLRVAFETDGDSATLFVVGTVANGSLTRLKAVTTTPRTVDERCTLTGAAARNAPDELATARERFVAENRSVDAAFIGRLRTQYAGDVDCSFLE